MWVMIFPSMHEDTHFLLIVLPGESTTGESFPNWTVTSMSTSLIASYVVVVIHLLSQSNKILLIYEMYHFLHE